MRQSIKYGSSMVIYTIIVLAIIVVINIVSIRHYAKIDLTSEGRFTLSPQTMKILNGLKEKIDIHIFLRPGKGVQISGALQMYKEASDKIEFHVLDPDKNPTLAHKYNVTEYGTVVVETESGRKESTQNFSEEELTNLIFKATTSKQKKICVLQGHGERDPESENPQGWNQAKSAMESAMYGIENLNWFATGAIPDECDLLLIVGPKRDYQPEEVAKLSTHVGKGGNLFLALDPVTLPNIEKFVSGLGVTLGDNMILDPLSQQLGFDPLVATAPNYAKHQITDGFKSVTLYTVARSLSISKSPPAWIKWKPVGRTAPQSWAETDLQSIEKRTPEYSDKDDVPGPLTISAAALTTIGSGKENLKIGENPTTGRIVLVGDSDFASNSSFNFSGNRDHFLNIVNWLLFEENRLSIRPKSKGFNPVIFNNKQILVVFLSSVIAMPLIAAIVGAVVFYRRRRS